MAKANLRANTPIDDAARAAADNAIRTKTTVLEDLKRVQVVETGTPESAFDGYPE